MITEERDRLQNVVKELKERRNLDGDTGLVNGVIVQVRANFHSFSSLGRLLHFSVVIDSHVDRSLKHLLTRRKSMSRN